MYLVEIIKKRQAAEFEADATAYAEIIARNMSGEEATEADVDAICALMAKGYGLSAETVDFDIQECASKAWHRRNDPLCIIELLRARMRTRQYRSRPNGMLV